MATLWLKPSVLRGVLGLQRCFASNIVTTQKDILREKPDIKLLENRFIYPEFLPDPMMNRRHHVREKLERLDMLRRRSVIDIPEFYVGSIMAVTVSDAHAPGKSNRFVGICIDREGAGLRHYFILRNVIDHQGVEIKYEQYNPTIQSIEVLRLERRLDQELYYLRDCPEEYSTFPFDMEQEILPEGTPVPVNPIKIKLKPPPWSQRWELQNLKGLQEFEVDRRKRKIAEQRAQPWEKYDLVKQYRLLIPEEEQMEIFKDVQTHLSKDKMGRALGKKQIFKKPIKTI